MSLDPSIQAFLEQAGMLSQPDSIEPTVLLRKLRKQDEGAKRLAEQARIQEPVAHIRPVAIPGPMGAIPARLYTPAGAGPFPILLFFHGGGWVAGTLDTHDLMCRRLCNTTGCLVLSVAYRLAPEHPFPAGLSDCYAATCWMATHAAMFGGDPARLAVSGDSGGGNLAAAVALMARDQDGPALVFQLLLWPAIDFQTSTPSWNAYDGYLMTKVEFMIIKHFYLSAEADQTNPYAAPLRATNLAGLPSALIITAECDPLRDGGEQYGRRLQEAGVSTTISRYSGMPHSFMHMAALVPMQADQAFIEASHTLRAAFSKSRT